MSCPNLITILNNDRYKLIISKIIKKIAFSLGYPEILRFTLQHVSQVTQVFVYLNLILWQANCALFGLLPTDI
jgi:hypothetical protein